MTDVAAQVDAQNDVQPDNDVDSDDSSSDDEEAGIRVYDISPQFLKTLLLSRNILSRWFHNPVIVETLSCSLDDPSLNDK